MAAVSRPAGFMCLGILAVGWMALPLADSPVAPRLAPAALEHLLATNDVVLVGEIHGTQESPAFVADAVEVALDQGRRVTVALEIPQDEGPVLQAYLKSPGGAESGGAGCEEAVFVKQRPFWESYFKDGRSSKAMCKLIQALHRLHAQGRPVSLLTIDPRPLPPAGSPVHADQRGLRQTPRDVGMAEALARSVETSRRSAPEVPHALLIALTGNLHQRLERGAPWDESYEPMGYRLALRLDRSDRQVRLIALDVHPYGGGEAWICSGMTPSSCGSIKLSQRLGDALPGESGHAWGVAVQTASSPNRSLGYYYFTVPVHASPPAVPIPLRSSTVHVATVQASSSETR